MSASAIVGWFQRNKTRIGMVFLAVYGAVMFVGPDIVPNYDTIQDALDKIGMFMVGAGAIKSDQFYRDRQPPKEI